MEKIIFFALVIPIIGFVLYLGATAIMQGFNAKEINRSEKEEDIIATGSSSEIDQLSNEITKLNESISKNPAYIQLQALEALKAENAKQGGIIPANISNFLITNPVV